MKSGWDLVAEGDVAQKHSNFGLAKILYRSALRSAQSAADDALACKAHGRLGRVCSLRHETSAAKQHFQQYLELLPEDTSERRRRCAGLASLARILCELGETRASHSLREEQLALGRTLGDSRIVADAYEGLGHACASLYEFNKAVYYFKKQLEIANEEKDVHGRLRALEALGDAYERGSDWSRALATFTELRGEAAEAQDTAAESHARWKIGRVLVERGEYSAAIPYLEDALTAAWECHDLLEEADVLQYLARAHRGLGLPAHAAQELEAAAAIDDRLHTFESARDANAEHTTYEALSGSIKLNAAEQDSVRSTRSAVYVSYASADHERVSSIVDVARSLGTPISLRSESRLDEEKPSRADLQELRSSNAYVCFLSPSFLASQLCMAELQVAQAVQPCAVSVVVATLPRRHHWPPVEGAAGSYLALAPHIDARPSVADVRQSAEELHRALGSRRKMNAPSERISTGQEKTKKFHIVYT